MPAEQVLDRTTDLKAVENGLRNKFRWDWLEEKDSNNDFLSEYIRKITQPDISTESVSYQTRISESHVSSSSNQFMESPLSRLADLTKSPRPSKYNFNADLGEYLEGEERCNFLIGKMKEIKAIYMNLKSEVASIDRRRKRIRRKERESSQASPSERDGVR